MNASCEWALLCAPSSGRPGSPGAPDPHSGRVAGGGGTRLHRAEFTYSHIDTLERPRVETLSLRARVEEEGQVLPLDVFLQKAESATRTTDAFCEHLLCVFHLSLNFVTNVMVHQILVRTPAVHPRYRPIRARTAAWPRSSSTSCVARGRGRLRRRFRRRHYHRRRYHRRRFNRHRHRRRRRVRRAPTPHPHSGTRPCHVSGRILRSRNVQGMGGQVMVAPSGLLSGDRFRTSVAPPQRESPKGP